MNSVVKKPQIMTDASMGGNRVLGLVKGSSASEGVSAGSTVVDMAMSFRYGLLEKGLDSTAGDIMDPLSSEKIEVNFRLIGGINECVL